MCIESQQLKFSKCVSFDVKSACKQYCRSGDSDFSTEETAAVAKEKPSHWLLFSCMCLRFPG